MKNLLFIILLGLAITTNGQAVNRTFERVNGSVNLLGVVTPNRLSEAPFNEWYSNSYESHEVDTESLDGVDLPDSITIFMGTWCGDSRREVPKFIRMLESRDYDMNKLNIICLNTGFQNYKQAPDREERGVGIHRVPTFILHDEQDVEIGRIVEEPVVSLEKDFAQIMKGEEYETAYPVAFDMINKLNKYSLKELRKMTQELIKEYREKSVSRSELNTYGYVLWASWDLMKAEFVFEFNTKLYPEEAYTHSSLASFKSRMGNDKEALKSVKVGLKLEPENERLIQMREDLGD
ncbi:MAG: hypothetical protein AB8B73_06175 [Ekhidna sp.]